MFLLNINLKTITLFSLVFNLYTMFDKVKGLYEFQKKARAIQKELKKAEFIAEGKGIIVTANGAQEIVSIDIDDTVLTDMNGMKLGKMIVELANKAMTKAQQHAATKMKEVGSGLGLPF